MTEAKHSEGWIAFATVVAAIAGVANIVFGGSALLAKEVFPDKTLVYVDLQTWGWVLVVFGILQVVAAFMLVARKNSGRIFTIIIAAISLIGWAAWVGQLPMAGFIALVLDILVIYGLSVTREYFT